MTKRQRTLNTDLNSAMVNKALTRELKRLERKNKVRLKRRRKRVKKI